MYQSLGVLMRWLHITSAITLLGGFIYARWAVAPALAAAEGSPDESLRDRIAARFRPLLFTAMALLLVSGLYNYLTKGAYPPHYHAIIGVKFLLVLHVFAIAFLYTLPNQTAAKRVRRLTSVVISGLIVVLISADLRWISLNPGIAPR